MARDARRIAARARGRAMDQARGRSLNKARKQPWRAGARSAIIPGMMRKIWIILRKTIAVAIGLLTVLFVAYAINTGDGTGYFAAIFGFGFTIWFWQGLGGGAADDGDGWSSRVGAADHSSQDWGLPFSEEQEYRERYSLAFSDSPTNVHYDSSDR